MNTRRIFSRHSFPDSSAVQSIDWIAKPSSIVLAAVVLFILIFSINLFLGWRQLEERKRITLNDDKTNASLLTYIIKERNKATIEILESYSHRRLFVTSVKNKDAAGIRRHMSDLKNNAEIDLTFVTDKRGFLWVNFPVFPEAIGKDLSSRDWYKGISSNWTPYISTVFQLIVGDKPLAAAYCVPIFDDQERVIGILATSQRLGFLEDINRRLPLNPNIKVSITDQKGQILYSNKYSYKESITAYRLFPIAEQALKAKKQQIEISDPQEDQEKICLTVVPVVDSGWSVIIERPLKDIFRLEMSSFIVRGVISFLLLLLIVSFLVYLRKVFLFKKTDELLQAEIKLRQSEEWHRNILKTTMDGFMAVDMQGNLLEVNDTYSRMSGYSEHELLTMRIPDLEASETLIDATAHIQKIVTEGEDRFESMHRRKDGSLFNVESSVKYQPTEGGRMVAFLRNITERKQAEEMLRKERNLVASIMETSPVGITTVNAKGEITFANSEAIVILGLSKDKISQITYNAPMWHISDLEGKPFPDDQLPFNIVMSTGKSVFDVQHAIQWPNGKRILLSINGVPMIDASGQITGMVASIEDMTQRKLAEKALRETNEYLNNLFNYANAPIITWDPQFRITRFNHSFELITGRKMEEVLGASIEILFPQEQMAKSLELIRKTTAGARWETVEIDILKIDGTIRTLLWNSATIFDEDGKIAIATIAQGQDITERKNAEEKYRTLFREMIDGFALHEIICDDKGSPTDYRFLAINPAFERMTGLKAEELIGRTVLDVLPGTERYWIENYGKVALTGEPALFENYAVELGKHFEVTAYQSAPNQFACIFADITVRKQAEEEKAKLEKQLFQSQKMEAIGTLAGGIAHDFNNILAIINGYTEMAMDEDSKEIRQKDLQETLKGTERAKNLVKQILTFSRQDDHEKKPLDIKVLLKEAIKFLRASIPSTIEIDQHITGKDSTIMADPTQMHQVIMNLCTNASHAMKKTGGILKIELSNIELAKGEINNHPELQPGHYMKLTINDTGHGIDPSIVKRIFDPFFTTKPVDEGTGLGLSVVYGIVKGHGGVINVYSEPGKGAAFHVYLPLIIQAETKEMDAGKPVIGGTERILFVDDEPALVDIILRMLFPLGYHVTGVASSKEALDIFRAEPESFDLVITDMTLPKMTGIDLSRKLLQIRPDIPIILCSGIKDPETEVQAKSLGIKVCLSKPLTKSELSQVVRETLDENKKPIS
jgi:PAS domain S-box-containing protein